MLKRPLIILFLTFICFNVPGQRIEYRNDSLFVNDFYVNAQTTKTKLDSLLKSVSKAKKSKSDIPKCDNPNKKVVRTTYFYYDLGLFFRKYDCDTSKLSVGIKLYNDSDGKYDKKKSELKNTYLGQLIIGGNLITGKREIQELEQMDNCKVTVSKLNFGSISTLIGGDIIYKKNFIRLSFDSKTSQLTNVYIHHNFQNE